MKGHGLSWPNVIFHELVNVIPSISFHKKLGLRLAFIDQAFQCEN